MATEAKTETGKPAPAGKKRRPLLIVMALVVLAGGGGAAWWFLEPHAPAATPGAPLGASACRSLTGALWTSASALGAFMVALALGY